MWAALGVAALLLWTLSHLPHTASSRTIIARPAVTLARLAGDPWLRVPLIVGWAWLGWHLFAR